MVRPRLGATYDSFHRTLLAAAVVCCAVGAASADDCAGVPEEYQTTCDCTNKPFTTLYCDRSTCGEGTCGPCAISLLGELLWIARNAELLHKHCHVQLHHWFEQGKRNYQFLELAEVGCAVVVVSFQRGNSKRFGA